MFKWAGVTLDFHDDGGETLKRIFPTAESLPNIIKTAAIQPSEKLANEQHALVALDSGHVLRKYAMNDAGSTAISTIYFMEHGHKLPDPARKMAANRLVDACGRYGLLAPQGLLKTAGWLGDVTGVNQLREGLEEKASRSQNREMVFPSKPSDRELQMRLEDVKSQRKILNPRLAATVAGLAGAGLGALKGPSMGVGRLGGAAVIGGSAALGAAGGVYAGGKLGNHIAHGIIQRELDKRKQAGLQEAVPGSGGFVTHDQLIQEALKAHEQQETPEEEQLEQQTGMEAHPDAIVGEGPAGFMPDANLFPGGPPPEMMDPSMLAPEEMHGAGVRPVDITGQAPSVKVAASRPKHGADFAVILPDGRRFYPIDTWDNVKLAHQYFEENERRMDPGVRHQFAEKLSAKAITLGYELPMSIHEAGATTYADDEHIKAALEMRKVAFYKKSAEHEFLDELLEKKAEIAPAVFAECVRRFDVMNGLDKAWDTGFLDPWSTTFGLEKSANKVVWEEGADRVTEGELQNLATNGSIPLQTVFTPMFANEFQKDPMGVFESMPAPQKKIIARMAVDVSHQGGSEGDITRGNVIPMRNVG